MSELWSWAKERFGLGFLTDHMIPRHANSPAYVVGGSVLVLVLSQIVTGILLQQFYSPVPAAAYGSVKYIAGDPVMGFVRGLHYWGAQVILMLIVLHLVRVYVSAAYKRPREVLWLSGLALLAVFFLLNFTGSILKWDQEGVEALAHNLEIAKLAGPLGYWFGQSFAPNVPFLIRINSLHVTILPLLAAGLIGLHVYLIRILGISSPKIASTKSNKPKEASVPFSTHMTRMVFYGSLAFLLVAVLALTVKPPLSSLGNPQIEVSKPDWYAMSLYGIENYFGLSYIPYAVAPVAILMLLAPVIDRGPETDPRKRKLMMALLISLIIIFVFLTVSAAVQPPKSHIG